MRKKALALALILILFSSIVIAAYYFSTDEPKRKGIVWLNPSAEGSSMQNVSPKITPLATTSVTQSYSPSDPTLVISNWYWNKSLYVSNESSIVIFASPEVGKTYNKSSINLTVNVATTSPSFIYSVSYRGDWQKNGNSLFFHLGNYGGYSYLFPTGLSINIEPTAIPDGNHTIVVSAVILSGQRDEQGHSISNTFSNSIDFVIDTTCPTIRIVTPANKTYDVSDIPLSFTIDEQQSKIEYELDEHRDTANGNITLTHIPNGNHGSSLFQVCSAPIIDHFNYRRGDY